jgi:type VI protein secretion system component Hcp
MIRVLTLSIVLLVLVAPAARAQIFWELTGETQGSIGGDATFSGEEGRIAVEYVAFGFSSTGSVGGTTAPQIYVNSVNLSKEWDSASVNLAAALSTAERFTRCVIRVYPPGVGATVGDSEVLGRLMPHPYELSVELIGARLEAFAVAGSGSFGASESISLVFDEIRVEHGPSLDLFTWSRPPARAATDAVLADALSPRGVSNPLEFDLPSEGDVTIEVTDSDGYTVRSLVYGDVSTYDGRILWDATDDAGRPVAPGVYVAIQREDGKETTRRIVIGH